MKKNKKLVGAHYAKKDYLIYLPLLQLYLELGLEIEKIHSIYKFKQCSHMKEFIEGNVSARHRATSKDEQKAFKTMSKSVFGCCLMNPVKYNQKSTIITSKDKFLKAERNPRFKHYIPLREDRVLCISDKPEVTVNFPSFIVFKFLN